MGFCYRYMVGVRDTYTSDTVMIPTIDFNIAYRANTGMGCFQTATINATNAGNSQNRKARNPGNLCSDAALLVPCCCRKALPDLFQESPQRFADPLLPSYCYTAHQCPIQYNTASSQINRSVVHASRFQPAKMQCSLHSSTSVRVQ